MQKPAEQAQPLFNIHRIFLAGVSLEMPKGAKTFQEASPPNLNVQVTPHITSLGNDFYEVVLRGQLEAKAGEKTLFLLEIDQTGIFEVRNFPPEQVMAVLGVNGPQILTPYLRAALTDTLSRATLPPFMLPEVNWAAIYAQQASQAANAAQGGTALH